MSNKYLVQRSRINLLKRQMEWVTEVRFVTAVTVAGSVNFFVSGVNFSKNTHFFVFLSLKLLKISEIKGVESLA